MSATTKQRLDWISPPPDGWAQPRVKDLFRDNTVNISVTQLSDLDVDHYSIPAFDEFGAPAQEHGSSIASNKTLLRGGELLFSKLNSHKPRVWLVPRDGSTKVASTEFIALSEWHEGTICLRFARYLLGSVVFAEYISCFQTSVTNSHKRINPEDLLRTRIPLPPLPEQARIADYLDTSCATIDAAVAAKRQQIQALNMIGATLIESAVTRGIRPGVKLREIGEEWIAEIPEHWSVCRIKRILSRVDYGTSQSTEIEGRFPVLKMGHIQQGEIEFRNLDFVDEIEENLLLEKGDLLYNRTNSPDQVGKAAIFRGDKTEGITFASYLVRLRVAHSADPYFLNYLINCNGFLSFARKMAIPSVQQSNLNSTRYCRLLVPLPPINEQREITRYLDTKLGMNKRAVSIIESQIESLLLYRKSLIHEFVTGKRRLMERSNRRMKEYV